MLLLCKFDSLKLRIQTLTRALKVVWSITSCSLYQPYIRKAMLSVFLLA